VLHSCRVNLPYTAVLVHMDTGTLIEVDDVLHFTTQRLTTLDLYPSEVPLGFDMKEYQDLCREHAPTSDKWRYGLASKTFGFHGLQGFCCFCGIDGQGGGVPFGSWPGWWGSVLELAGAVLLLVGLASRPAAILLSGVMAYAYFTVHAPMGLLPLQNMGEPSAVYAWVFLLFAAVGPGRFALDNLIKRRR